MQYTKYIISCEVSVSRDTDKSLTFKKKVISDESEEYIPICKPRDV